jgi:hypothetical protein
METSLPSIWPLESPENNINFTDGLGYFAKSDDYANYLKHSKDDLVSQILHLSVFYFANEM